jgi:hypothetical protein
MFPAHGNPNKGLKIMNITFLPYKEILNLEDASFFSSLGIPLEHTISIPLPTKRWDGPGYAFFASSTFRSPGQPKEQAAPDRWWVVDAQNPYLKIYVKWDTLPFAQGVQWESVQILPGRYSKSEIQERRETVKDLMDAVVPDFFGDNPGNPSARKILLEALIVIIPEQLLEQYRYLVPDFFQWLDASHG